MSPAEGKEVSAGSAIEPLRPAVEPPAAGNVDKIRDILFGPQMRDYDRRFTRLEDAVMKEAADLRESTRKRFEALETYIRKEFDALEDRLKAERAERGASHEGLAKRIGDLNDQTSGAHRELRGTILDQSKQIGEEIERRHQELSALLDRRFQELRKDKTDRAALAALFSEAALRLTDEFQVPGVNA